MLSQTIAWGQVKEISAGIAPYCHVRLRDSKNKVDLLSHSFSISKPASPSVECGFSLLPSIHLTNNKLIIFQHIKRLPSSAGGLFTELYIQKQKSNKNREKTP